MPVQLNKRLLTVEEYHKMGEVGILQEKNIELINGEIIAMSPVGSKHLACVNKLNALLNTLLGTKAIVSVQNPIVASNLSEPEPDISLLTYRPDFYVNEVPHAKDVLLVIEVADTSVMYDREVKLPLYAESSIPEFWLINLEVNEIEVYWLPSGDAYKFRELLRPGDVLKGRNVEISFAVKDILG